MNLIVTITQYIKKTFYGVITHNKCTIQSNFRKMNKPLQPLFTSRNKTFPALPRIPICSLLHFLSSPRVTTLLTSHIFDWFCLFSLTLYMKSYSVYFLMSGFFSSVSCLWYSFEKTFMMENFKHTQMKTKYNEP